MEYALIVITCIATISVISNLYKDITIAKITKQYQEERKDLLNRIMAKNLNEYRQVDNNSLPKGNNLIKDRVLGNKEDFEGLYK